MIEYEYKGYSFTYDKKSVQYKGYVYSVIKSMEYDIANVLLEEGLR